MDLRAIIESKNMGRVIVGAFLLTLLIGIVGHFMAINAPSGTPADEQGRKMRTGGFSTFALLFVIGLAMMAYTQKK